MLGVKWNRRNRVSGACLGGLQVHQTKPIPNKEVFAAIFVCKILAGNLIEVFFVFSKYNLNFLVLVFTLAYICISTREQWCVAYRVWCAHLVSHFWELVVEICIALRSIIVVVDYDQWQYFCWLTNV